MNYYPFHIGDYVSATRHLSWDEDAAYRRLLDVYYTLEKPLPADLRQACRLVLATTDTQREAVRVVLEEFFEQTEEGWINKRADDEIFRMRERQEESNESKGKAIERKRRFNERREHMFAALRGVGIVPDWNVPMNDLQCLFDEHCNTTKNTQGTEQERSGNKARTFPERLYQHQHQG